MFPVIYLSSFVAFSASVAAVPPPPYGGLPNAYTYVALTDMALAAPIVVAADIASAVPIKDAAGVPAGKVRYYVEADAKALISGHAELPARISYQVDIPADPKGKKLKLKGVPVLLLATLAQGAAEPGMLRLIGPNAQVPRTPENESKLRADSGGHGRARCAARHHRDHPRLPRRGIAAGRERDADIPADGRCQARFPQYFAPPR